MGQRQIRGFWLRQNDGASFGQHGSLGDASVPERGDEGFLLIGAIVLVFLVLLALTVAAPRMAREMQREKEIESQHRANQYVRAIRMYYKKFNHYPSSIEQLENTNRQRFLREKYLDPLTGKDDWRLIHVGENKTKVKGFFGQDLPGLQAGLGSASSLASPTGGGPAATTGSAGNAGATGMGFGGTSAGSSSAFGSSAGSSSAFGSSAGASSTGTFGSGSSAGTGALGSTGSSTGLSGAAGTGSGTATTGSGTTGTGIGGSGVSSQDATSATGTGGPIMGIGSSKSGDAMLAINEQTTYQTWEFLYDPRIEQLYAKANLLGGGVSSSSASSLGSASSLTSPGQTTGLGAPSGGNTNPTNSPTSPTTSPTSPTSSPGTTSTPP